MFLTVKRKKPVKGKNPEKTDNNNINNKNMKTMKIMRRLMGCAAAILALSACSESEDLLSAFHSDPNAVRITAQVGKASANGFTRSYPLGVKPLADEV